MSITPNPHDMTFLEFLEAAQRRTHSRLAVGLRPVLNQMPLALTRYDDPFLPYGKAVIDALADRVCAFVFHLGAYLAHGAAGAVALERTIAYAPRDAVKVLHGPFVSADYVRAAFDDALDCHAVTLARCITPEAARAYLGHPRQAAFVITEDGLSDALQPLIEEYPGQLGVAVVENDDRGLLTLAGNSTMIWHWGSALFDTREDSYVKSWRAAADKLR